MIQRILGFIVFFSIFLSIYALMNYYVLARIAGMLGISKNIYFYAVFAAATLSYIATNMVEAAFSNTLTRFMYYISSVWMGVMFIALFVLLVFEIANLAFRPDTYASAIVIISIVSILSLYSMYNASQISVKKI